LQASPDAEPISGETLAEMARKYLLAEAVITRLSRVIDPESLGQILDGFEPDLSNESAAVASAEQLQELFVRVGDIGDQPPSVRADYNEKQEHWRLIIERYLHGNVRVSTLDYDFLQSADYTTLKEGAALVKGLVSNAGEVRRGSGEKQRSAKVTDFGAAVRWLLNEADRGINLQRYKGLGEMNAEQLWETTMDASVRRLLKVQIEDAIAADQIFSTLMGDDVEPRRAFIEQNALVAQNIDV
jgi:DNA gyrase subunit B